MTRHGLLPLQTPAQGVFTSPRQLSAARRALSAAPLPLAKRLRSRSFVIRRAGRKNPTNRSLMTFLLPPDVEPSRAPVLLANHRPGRVPRPALPGAGNIGARDRLQATQHGSARDLVKGSHPIVAVGSSSVTAERACAGCTFPGWARHTAAPDFVRQGGEGNH